MASEIRSRMGPIRNSRPKRWAFWIFSRRAFSSQSGTDQGYEYQKTIVELQNEQQMKIDRLEHELTTMETQTSTTRSLLNSMEQAVPATVTDFGRQLFQQIQDQEDVDHI